MTDKSMFPFSHRMGLAVARAVPVEIGRETDATGDVVITESALSRLDEVGQGEPYVSPVGESYVLRTFRHSDGRVLHHACGVAEGYVEVIRIGHTRKQMPAPERGHAAWGYATRRDLLATLKDDGVLEELGQELAGRCAVAAVAAMSAADGSEIDPVLAGSVGRAGYEAACVSVGVQPADDDVVHQWTLTYSLSECTVDHILWGRLTQARTRGLRKEAERAEAEALARLNAEVPADDGRYSRERYEAGCAVVGVEPASDSRIRAGIEWARGVKLTLMSRRIAGMQAESGLRHCGECGAVVHSGGMHASTGLACSPRCYDAMADRPGRHDARQRRTRA